MEPLAQAVLAGLTPSDVDVKFYDDRLESIPFDQPTDLVSISVETYTAVRAYQIASEYRRRGVPVVMGGFHATLCPEEVATFADAVVIGEAETLWNELIDDFRHGALKPRYQSAGRPSLGITRYDRSIFRGKRYVAVTLVEAGRGCHFRCEFCAIQAYFKSTQIRRPIDRILADIADAKTRKNFRGVRGALTLDKVKLLEPTGGSSGASKLIPYTTRLQTEFSRAIGPWIVDLARDHTAILGGPAYWAISPSVTDIPTGAADFAGNSGGAGVPVGFDADSAYLGRMSRSLIDSAMVDCSDLKQVAGIEDFRRLTLLRLLRTRGLRLVSVWHPSFLTLLLDALADSWERLLWELGRGLPASGKFRGIARDASRAAELRHCKPEDVRSIWPQLALVSCWGDGHAQSLLPSLQGRMQGVAIQPKGLIATEAFVSLPFGGMHPLAVRSHFFEFIDECGRPRVSWDLEEGGHYSVVVTTGGGLYRYRLRDRIAVTGYVGQTPCIRFLGKEDGVSDLCGEKLSESFVAGVLSQVLPRFANEVQFALLAPEHSRQGPEYVLFVESLADPNPKLAEEVERALCANPQYAYCIRLGQLRPVTVCRTVKNANARYMGHLNAQGQKLGDIKPAALSPLTGWMERLACDAPRLQSAFDQTKPPMPPNGPSGRDFQPSVSMNGQ
jgi:GH3 auxin-responsive promoter